MNEVNLIKYSLSNEFIDDELTVAFPSGRKDLPDHWKCPITKKLMHLPVKCPFTGVTYEQSALLLKYLESYGKEQTSKIALNLIRDEKIVLEIRDAYS